MKTILLLALSFTFLIFLIVAYFVGTVGLLCLYPFTWGKSWQWVIKLWEWNIPIDPRKYPNPIV